MKTQATPVLVVTADQQLQKATRQILARHRAEVRTATNALECLDLLRSDLPELIVLDDSLLWGGAEGVVARISEDQASTIKVLILTDNEDHSRWKHEAVIGYPSKARLLAAVK